MTFDLGLGNGLKNKLVEALKANDKDKIKALISSTYVSSLAIVSVIFTIGVLSFSFLDFNALFNISSTVLSPFTLRISAILVFGSICLEFVLKNVIYIYQALQKQAIASSFSLISSALICLFTLVVRFSDVSQQLIWMSVGYLAFVNLPLLGGNIIVFAKQFSYARPSFRKLEIHAARSVMTLGIAFFGIQIALLILNSANDLLISNIFGPSYTTIFNYYNKPFNMIYSLYSLVTLPYWAMVVKAKTENNVLFVKKMLIQMLVVGCIFILVVLF
jgi:O-antigen/teichoic acid export membrane protein